MSASHSDEKVGTSDTDSATYTRRQNMQWLCSVWFIGLKIFPLTFHTTTLNTKKQGKAFCHSSTPSY